MTRDSPVDGRPIPAWKGRRAHFLRSAIARPVIPVPFSALWTVSRLAVTNHSRTPVSAVPSIAMSMER